MTYAPSLGGVRARVIGRVRARVIARVRTRVIGVGSAYTLGGAAKPFPMANAMTLAE